METQSPKSLQLIYPELRRRFLAPCGSVTFFLHLIGGVIIFGGIGVFYSIWRPHLATEQISGALLGYFPPLVGAALLEFDLEDQPYIRSFGLFAFIVFFILTVFIITSAHWWQLVLSIIGTASGILFWWVAHGLNSRFNDVKPQSAIGGDPSAELHASTDKDWAT